LRPEGRPRPLFRGAGAERERAWGAVTWQPAEPGDELTIVTRRGKTWTATVDEVVRPEGDGHLVTLRGEAWHPDPEHPEGDGAGDDPAPGGDPAWMADESADLAPGWTP